MGVSMRGTRWLILVAIIVVLGGVAATYRLQKRELHDEAPAKPEAMAAELSSAAQDWSWIETSEPVTITEIAPVKSTPPRAEGEFKTHVAGRQLGILRRAARQRAGPQPGLRSDAGHGPPLAGAISRRGAGTLACRVATLRYAGGRSPPFALISQLRRLMHRLLQHGGSAAQKIPGRRIGRRDVKRAHWQRRSGELRQMRSRVDGPRAQHSRTVPKGDGTARGAGKNSLHGRGERHRAAVRRWVGAGGQGGCSLRLDCKCRLLGGLGVARLVHAVERHRVGPQGCDGKWGRVGLYSATVDAIVGRVDAAAGVGGMQGHLHSGDIEGAIQRAGEAVCGDRNGRVVTDGTISSVARIDTAVVPSPDVGGVAALAGALEVKRARGGARERRAGVERIPGSRRGFAGDITRIRIPSQADAGYAGGRQAAVTRGRGGE